MHMACSAVHAACVSVKCTCFPFLIEWDLLSQWAWPSWSVTAEEQGKMSKQPGHTYSSPSQYRSTCRSKEEHAQNHIIIHYLTSPGVFVTQLCSESPPLYSEECNTDMQYIHSNVDIRIPRCVLNCC